MLPIILQHTHRFMTLAHVLLQWLKSYKRQIKSWIKSVHGHHVVIVQCKKILPQQKSDVYPRSTTRNCLGTQVSGASGHPASQVQMSTMFYYLLQGIKKKNKVEVSSIAKMHTWTYNTHRGWYFFFTKTCDHYIQLLWNFEKNLELLFWKPYIYVQQWK
jgi:hypothetical protein